MIWKKYIEAEWNYKFEGNWPSKLHHYEPTKLVVRMLSISNAFESSWRKILRKKAADWIAWKITCNYYYFRKKPKEIEPVPLSSHEECYSRSFHTWSVKSIRSGAAIHTSYISSTTRCCGSIKANTDAQVLLPFPILTKFPGTSSQ